MKVRCGLCSCEREKNTIHSISVVSEGKNEALSFALSICAEARALESTTLAFADNE